MGFVKWCAGMLAMPVVVLAVFTLTHALGWGEGAALVILGLIAFTVVSVFSDRVEDAERRRIRI